MGIAYHERAAKMLLGPMPRSEVDPATLAMIVGLVQTLVRLAALICKWEGPEELQEWLVKDDWTLLERLLGQERRRDRRVRQAFTDHWKGDTERGKRLYSEYCWARDNGRITKELLRGLYQELVK